MNKHLIILTTLLFVLCSQQIQAQIPRTLSYQGVLTDSLGNPKADNTYNLTFRLYDGALGGSALWTEVKILQVKRGLFSTILGDQTTIPDSLMFDRPYWLSIQIASEQELSPRIPLTAVGYSLYSVRADTANFAVTTPQQAFVDSARIAGTIPNNSITSQKILDGTIQRVDVVPTFTAPYADTASYARVAPQSSTVDSARIASTVPNNSITTIKIADGTIQREDVVSTFVAPYSDTAQYARVVPTQGFVDSARIAGSIIDNAITSAKIVNGTIASIDIADGAVTTSKINQSGATNGQVLKWNGSTWDPAADSTGGLTLPYSGTGTSGGPLFNIVNLGTSGAISTLSSGNYALWGEAASSSGIGVYGVNKTTTGTTYGVFGDVYSSSGFSGYFQGGKFYIQGNTGIGIQDPSAKLEVNGQVKITGGSPGASKVLTSDATGLASWQVPESSPWLKNSSDIYYNAGNVGIGLNNPAGMLEIYGNSIDTYPHLFLSEADGFARVSFRTMLASTKHWVLAGHTNLTDATSQWHLNYFNGSAGKNIFSVYGNSIIAFDGDVGIGTQTPTTKLQVVDPTPSSDLPAIRGEHAVTDYFGTGVEGIGRWRGVHGEVNATGSESYSGVQGMANTTAAGTAYGVFGSASTVGGIARAGYFVGDLEYTGSLVGPPSDEKLKKNIGNLDGVLSKIINLQTHSFEYKSDGEFSAMNLPTGKRYGLMAQELETNFPELVTESAYAGNDKTAQPIRYKGVKYTELIPILLEAIKEQQKQIENLQRQVDQIKINR